MARIKGKDIYLKHDDQVYFGDSQEAALWFFDNELRLDHTISGTKATQGYHLARFDQIPDEFIDLDDTPNSYSGYSQKIVAVNQLETGLEFTTISGYVYYPFTPGSLMPGEVGSRPSTRIAGPVGGYSFDDTNEESVFATLRIPAEYRENTNITFGFCCFNNSGQTGSNAVRWSIDYHTYNPYDLYGSKTTSTYSLDIDFTNNASAGEFGHGHLTIPYNDVNNQLHGHTALTFRLYRDSTSVSDTLTGDAVLVMCCGAVAVDIGD